MIIGLKVTSGGLVINNQGLTVTDGMSIHSSGLKVQTDDIVVTSAGMKAYGNVDIGTSGVTGKGLSLSGGITGMYYTSK